MKTTIVISAEIRNQLEKFKRKLKVRSFSEVIQKMLSMIKKFKLESELMEVK